MVMLSDGRLPDGEDVKVAMRPGGRSACAACAQRIRPSEWRLLVTSPTGDPVSLCIGCFEAWLEIRGEHAWGGPCCYFCSKPMRAEQHGLLINTVFVNDGEHVAHAGCMPEQKSAGRVGRNGASRIVAATCGLCAHPIADGDAVVENGAGVVHSLCDAVKRKPIGGGAVVSPLWFYEAHRRPADDVVTATHTLITWCSATRRTSARLYRSFADGVDRMRLATARYRSAAAETMRVVVSVRAVRARSQGSKTAA